MIVLMGGRHARPEFVVISRSVSLKLPLNEDLLGVSASMASGLMKHYASIDQMITVHKQHVVRNSAFSQFSVYSCIQSVRIVFVINLIADWTDENIL